MIVALFRSLGQLSDTRVIRAMTRTIGLSIMLFVLLALGVWWLFRSTTLSEWAVLEWVVDLIGSVLPVVGALFLFPIVAQLLLGFFLEDVAEAVEQRHYSDAPAAKGVGVLSGVGASIRFLLKALLINAVLLFMLVLPVTAPAYPIGWILCNSYLIGREYFELVALRRMSAKAARDLRRRHAGSTMFGGILGMCLFAIPVVNFIAPVIVTMLMTHACMRWLRSESKAV
jgi:CysZ protein